MKHALLLSLLVGCCIVGAARPVAAAGNGLRPDVSVVRNAAAPSVTLTITLDESLLSASRTDGLDVLRLKGGDVSVPAGAPAVPGFTVRVALPDGMRATGVRVLGCEEAVLDGRFRVAPARPPQPKTAIGSSRPSFVEPRTLGAAEPQSASPRARLTGQADLAGQSFAVLRLDPLRYSADRHEIALATVMEILIEGEWGHVCGDYLPGSASDRERSQVARRLHDLVVNPSDVTLRMRAPSHRGVAPGDYDCVIITDAAWVDDFAPLANWRTRKGVRTNVVSMGWITVAGGYSGTTLEKVRAFVEDAHATWGATDFLLGADSHIIPYAMTSLVIPGYWTEDIPHDTYYADYDDDFVCEVNVGRAPMRSSSEIASFTAKMLAYEKNPPPTGWATTAAYFGFDISVPGDADGEVCKEMIRSMHLPAWWTLDTEYDIEPGPHRQDVIGYLNAGYHLVNHHDHCNASSMGTGWISHGDIIQNAEIAALSNGNRQSFCFAVGCNPCDFTVYTSIAEEFVKNPSGGGFAFIGNTRTGWGGPVEDPDWYNVRQDRFFYRNLFDDGFVYLGENFSDLKNDEYDPNDPYNLHRQVFLQLTLIGDPALPIWTADPAPLAVTHPPEVYAGLPNSFAVTVEDGSGPIDGATVCLWKGNDVYEVAQTSGGAATLSIVPATAGTLLMTAWAPNHLPYEADVTVDDDLTGVDGEPQAPATRLAFVAIAPNPTASSADLALVVPPDAGSVLVAIYNVRGQLVRRIASEAFESGIRALRWDGRDDAGVSAAAGVYFCVASSGRDRAVGKLVLLR